MSPIPTPRHLQSVPECVPEEDLIRLRRTGRSIRDQFFLLEEMLEKYPFPYFMLRLAETQFQLQADITGLELCRKAQRIMKEGGLVDERFDNFIVSARIAANMQAEKARAASEQSKFYQRWLTTKSHKFPTSLPHLPPGHDPVSHEWVTLKSTEGNFLACYMRSLAIETNQVENVFSLSDTSMKDLIQNGVTDGKVQCTPGANGMLQDPNIIKDIINDTLAAYDLLEEVVENPKALSKELICRIHARLMKSSRVLPKSSVYVPPGVTRSITKKTAIVSGTYLVECCPYSKVDEELDYICRMAKQYICNWRNPFSTASWLHLILARCHPFEDGSGRVARMIASVPLLMNGFPPIYITHSQRQAYYESIGKCCDGDHKPFVECVFKGMQDSIEHIKELHQ